MNLIWGASGWIFKINLIENWTLFLYINAFKGVQFQIYVHCVFAEINLCISAALCVPVATLVHVMEGFGSPWASQASLAVLSAGNDTVLMCGSAILGLDLRTGAYEKDLEIIVANKVMNNIINDISILFIDHLAKFCICIRNT